MDLTRSQVGQIEMRLNRVLCAVLALWVCGTLSGCDALYRVLDKEGAEEKQLLGDIVPFESNPLVEEAQALLYLYGYNAGKADGILGLRTRNAIEKFQQDNGLEASRFLDKATWERLNVFTANKLVIERQLNVLLVQKLLKAAKCDPGKADGKMGAKTREAVLQFQKSHGLKADGKIGHKTLGKLADYLTEKIQNEAAK